ncbi:ImmA/IrrE family metallo-endopeptidase [Robbsia andropogonis]|nr:ImmA/IrrE family metallo-endopeptidase [Robbsia andropogonis]
MTKLYRRPLLVFYLNEPPQKAERGEDFRTLPVARRAENEGAVDALVRDVHVRQRLILSALEEAEEAVAHPYVGSATIRETLPSMVAKVVEGIGFDRAAFRRQRTIEDAFAYLRERIEGTGIFLLLIGTLGSHHSAISPEVFRGFAIADRVAPFIVVNDQDAKSAWAFTALHELVHIWLGETGVSGGVPAKRIEQFCNDVASRVLVDDTEIGAIEFDIDDFSECERAIASFARAHRVSRPLVAYRLLQQQRISEPVWHALNRHYTETRRQERDSQPRGESGPSYYIVKRHRMGGALIDLVKRTVAEGILTPTKAARVLDVKPTNVATLLGGA